MRSRSRRLFAALAVLAVCSIVIMLKHMAEEAKTSSEEERRLADQLCGSGRRGSARRCSDLKLKDKNLIAKDKYGRTEKQVANERDAVDTREEERVVSRVETCLLATNMSSYLKEQGYLSNAYNNARDTIHTLRTLIPRTFNSDYLSPCWEMDFQATVKLEDKTVKWVVDGIEAVTPFSALGYEKPSENKLFSRHHGTVMSPLVCLPKFFIGGFPKCGTSYTYCVVGQRFGGGLDMLAPLKEPNFWSSTKRMVMFDSTDLQSEVERISPYLFNYIDTSKRLASSHYQPKHQQLLTADGSTQLIVGGLHWNKDDPRGVDYCLLPAVMSEVLPDSKYVVAMRNPVDRLYSSFWFSCRERKYSNMNATLLYHNGRDIFHERVATKLKQFTQCSKTYPLAVCLDKMSLSPDLLTCGKTALENGIYYIHILKWLSVVSRDNFVFLTLEELSTDINAVEKKLLAVLGSDYPHDLILKNKDLSACSSRTNSQTNYHSDPRLQMRDDTREMLIEFYRPYNQKLADLLGDEKFLWEK